jgi:hypothetical protein
MIMPQVMCPAALVIASTTVGSPRISLRLTLRGSLERWAVVDSGVENRIAVLEKTARLPSVGPASMRRRD